MRPTKLKSLLENLKWHNEKGTTESFRNAAVKLGIWVLHLWALGRFDPNTITVCDKKEEPNDTDR